MVWTSANHVPMRNKTARSLVLINLVITLSLLSLCLSDRVHAQVAAPSGYSLVGTIQSQNFIGAVIIVTKGEQSLFRLFDKLPDGSQIIKVRPDSISLKGEDGTTFNMYIAHEMKTVASVPYSTSDPFAGKVWNPAAERPVSAYEKRHQIRRGTQSSDGE